jgi:hypothetical protein
MATLGISEQAGFWVGGKAGRVLHGDAGAIAARIERTNVAAGALRREIGEMAVLLTSDAAPRGGASEVLRQQMAAATTVLSTFEEASRATIAAIVESGEANGAATPAANGADPAESRAEAPVQS